MALHVYVAQYTIIAAKTVPSRAEVQHLFCMMDEDNSGSLDFEEFRQLSVYIYIYVCVCYVCSFVFLSIYLSKHDHSPPRRRLSGDCGDVRVGVSETKHSVTCEVPAGAVARHIGTYMCICVMCDVCTCIHPSAVPTCPSPSSLILNLPSMHAYIHRCSR